MSADPFQAEYRPLSAHYPGWGAVALLPWDEAIFGFPVADFASGSAPPVVTTVPDFQASLIEFSSTTGAALVSARVAGPDTAAQAALIAAGFIPVELSLTVTRHLNKADELPRLRFPLRPATSEDHDAILSICGRAFEFGRYHTDPRFPRALAHRRYTEWMRRALSGNDPNEYIFVLGGQRKLNGFMHVLIRDRKADLRLAAVNPDCEIGFAGFSLYAETLATLHSMSVSSVSSKIAASNTRVLNIYAALKFRFSCPQLTLHWHAPHAARLFEASLTA
jgi:hypothetical protein